MPGRGDRRARRLLELSEIVASEVRAQSFYSARTADGVARINAYRRLERLPAFVVVGWGEKDYLAQWRTSARRCCCGCSSSV